ncbi:ABC-three component system middle component 6 [Candidatus Rariloculus sp.]|uniref:ABC-three component system middle component 6 n=1 Tax=Candidatus Rariloculus sp. TaxID=3101265 RepID=UPI003D0E6F81
MILPTKHIRPDRALIGVGAEMLETLERPMTVSMLWDDLRLSRSADTSSPVIDYRWFVLALDLLFMLSAVEFERGVIRKATP